MSKKINLDSRKRKCLARYSSAIRWIIRVKNITTPFLARSNNTFSIDWGNTQDNSSQHHKRVTLKEWVPKWMPWASRVWVECSLCRAASIWGIVEHMRIRVPGFRSGSAQSQQWARNWIIAQFFICGSCNYCVVALATSECNLVLLQVLVFIMSLKWGSTFKRAELGISKVATHINVT